jgi:hypothetical protein
MVDDPDDDTGTDDTGTEDDWTPPTREEFEKLKGDLGRTREEAKQHRLKLKAEREKASGNGSGATSAAPGGQPAIDLEGERRKWQAETDKRIIGERARTALAAAGLVIPDGQDSNAAISRAVRMMDLDSCALTDTGSVSGLDAELDSLRAMYPGMFKAARRTGASVDGGTAGRSGASSTTTTGAKPSSAGKLAARWANGGKD